MLYSLLTMKISNFSLRSACFVLLIFIVACSNKNEKLSSKSSNIPILRVGNFTVDSISYVDKIYSIYPDSSIPVTTRTALFDRYIAAGLIITDAYKKEVDQSEWFKTSLKHRNEESQVAQFRSQRLSSYLLPLQKVEKLIAN